MLPLGRLLLYHVKIIRKGETTNEDLRKTYKIINHALPYSKIECHTHQHEDQDILISEYHMYKSRNVELQSRSTDTERKNIFNSLIENEHL